MFVSQMHIEGNVATIGRGTEDYRMVITVERHGAAVITREEVERVLPKNLPTMFVQRQTFGAH